MTNRLSIFASWLVTLLTPLALLGLAMRLLLTPLFLQIEYRLPSFPPDEYGFTISDRLTYANFALNYLVNNEDLSYLSQLNFPDGSPLFNERELSHMEDVKIVTQAGLRTWYVSLLLLILVGIWGRRESQQQAFRQGLKRGGRLSVGLAAGIGLFAAFAFWQFFTLFHAMFFEGDSWLFLYSDTLIRLFPMRFWQDAFLWVGVFLVGGGLLLGLGVKPKKS